MNIWSHLKPILTAILVGLISLAVLSAAKADVLAPDHLMVIDGGVRPAIKWAWSGADPTVMFNVKRSTVSGGPYTTVSRLQTVPRFKDKGISDTNPYYYIVTATVNGMESPNSVEVSATPKQEKKYPIFTLMPLDLIQSNLTGLAQTLADHFKFDSIHFKVVGNDDTHYGLLLFNRTDSTDAKIDSFVCNLDSGAIDMFPNIHNLPMAKASNLQIPQPATGDWSSETIIGFLGAFEHNGYKIGNFSNPEITVLSRLKGKVASSQISNVMLTERRYRKMGQELALGPNSVLTLNWAPASVDSIKYDTIVGFHICVRSYVQDKQNDVKHGTWVDVDNAFKANPPYGPSNPPSPWDNWNYNPDQFKLDLCFREAYTVSANTVSEEIRPYYRVAMQVTQNQIKTPAEKFPMRRNRLYWVPQIDSEWRPHPKMIRKIRDPKMRRYALSNKRSLLMSDDVKERLKDTTDNITDEIFWPGRNLPYYGDPNVAFVSSATLTKKRNNLLTVDLGNFVFGQYCVNDKQDQTGFDYDENSFDGGVKLGNGDIQTTPQTLSLENPEPTPDEPRKWYATSPGGSDGSDVLSREQNMAILMGHGDYWRVSTKGASGVDQAIDFSLLQKGLGGLAPGGPQDYPGRPYYLVLNACSTIPSPLEPGISGPMGSLALSTPEALFRGIHGAYGFRTPSFFYDDVMSNFGFYTGLRVPVLASWLHAVENCPLGHGVIKTDCIGSKPIEPPTDGTDPVSEYASAVVVPGNETTDTIDSTGSEDASNGLAMYFQRYAGAMPASTLVPTLDRANLTVHLSWQPGIDASAYHVFKGTSRDNLVQIATLLPIKTTWFDDSVVAGQTYYYQVTSVMNLPNYFTNPVSTVETNSTGSNLVTVVVP